MAFLTSFFTYVFFLHVIFNVDIINRALNAMITQRDDLISTFSHELRTPLNGILGSLQLLQFETQGAKFIETATVQESLDGLHHSTLMLRLMLTNLLDRVRDKRLIWTVVLLF
jgi:signal transduction histidine kinase